MRLGLPAILFLAVISLNVCTSGAGVTGIEPYDESGLVLETDFLAKNITTSDLPADWWKNAVFYEIFVRSYKDSNGDGYGDLQGVIGKLDYLKDLGVGGIWLMPITEDPMNDHGYNVSDCRSVEDTYGTMDDLLELITKAHEKNIGIIIDIVPNHISKVHPYFLAARSNRNSKFRNFFLWKDSNDLSYYDLWENNNYPWYQSPTGYYFSVFYGDYPDLNYTATDNCAKIFMSNNIIFWLNNGVDGFRYDAISHLVENGTTYDLLYDQPETVSIMKEFSALVRQYDNKYTIGEQSASETYLGDGTDLLNSTFGWGYGQEILWAIKSGKTKPLYITIEDALKNNVLNDLPDGTKKATLLSNHDAICGERPYDQLSGDIKKCKLAASSYLLAPGIPYIYYGEEIGMKKYTAAGSALDENQALRTPMQWDTSAYAGFSTVKPYRPINANYATYNVESEKLDSGSIFNHYKKLLSIRNQHAAIQDGSYQLVLLDANTWTFLRKNGSDIVGVSLNFTSSAQTITLNFTGTDLGTGSFVGGNDLYDSSCAYPDLTDTNRSSFQITVPAYGVRIINFQ